MRVILMLICLAAATAGVARAAESASTFYVQLVRGTDTDRPPAPGCKCVGPKLAKTFGPVFKCKGFWEINCQEVAVSPGRTRRVKLGNGHEAEIDLGGAKERTVAAFQDGKLVDRMVVPRGDGMTIIGGSRTNNGVWFIVVRRDKPRH